MKAIGPGKERKALEAGIGGIEVARYAVRTFCMGTWLGGETYLSPVSRPHDSKSWENGTCVAQCLSQGHYISSNGFTFTFTETTPDHAAPQENCSCGVYGSLSLYNLARQYSMTEKILAIIAAEGTTIIGSRGLRTQYARVVAWWSSDGRSAAAAGRQFQGAVEFHNIHEMLDDYGLPYYPEPDNGPISGSFSSIWWTR